MKLKYIPNMICVLRIILVAPIVWSLLQGRYGLALGLILVAGFSDALDGFLARRFDWRTRLGGLLDPAADKLLMFAAYVTLAWIGLVPIWFSAIVVGRDIIIITGAIVYQLYVAPVHGEPTGASKLNTVLQILFVLFTISSRLARPTPHARIAAPGCRHPDDDRDQHHPIRNHRPQPCPRKGDAVAA